MFWNINETLTHDRLFNFIVGNRGGGKTYGAKNHAIKSFLKDGSQFVYVRRYKEELKLKKKFFDDIKDKFPDHTFEIKGNEIYIDEKLAGCFMSLSTSKIQKSNPFPRVNKIIFDEFILDKGFYHYLSDEVVNFLELYETICRMRVDMELYEKTKEVKEINPVKVYFLSNAITVTNPYFLYFKFRINNVNKRFHHFGDMLVEFVNNKEFIELKKQTRFGKMIDGTQYGEYAIENSFLRDNTTFVEKKTDKAKHYFSMKYLDKVYHVWVDWSGGRYYISKDKDPYQLLLFCLTQADHTPNTLLLKGRKDRILSEFVENYKLGNVYFEDMNIKNVFYDIIRLFLM